MHDHVVVDKSDSGAGTGMIVGVLLALILGAVVLFFVFGGPGRFAGQATTPSNTNVNVPAQQQPQQPQQPAINVPKQIDVNVNQPPAQQPSGQQQAPAPGGANR
jgi:hypothetical protein